MSNVNSDKDDIFAGMWEPFFADMAKSSEAIEALTGEEREEQEAVANTKIKNMADELWTVFVKAKEAEKIEAAAAKKAKTRE
jgi:hypothetical protein